MAEHYVVSFMNVDDDVVYVMAVKTSISAESAIHGVIGWIDNPIDIIYIARWSSVNGVKSR